MAEYAIMYENLGRSYSTEAHQPTTIDTQFTTVATLGTHDPPQRRVMELESQLEDSAAEPGTVHGEGYSGRLASLAAALRQRLKFRPRLHDAGPTGLSWRDRLVSFARRNNTNLFTTFVAVTTVFLLLPLCVLYYKAGTMAAGMHQKRGYCSRMMAAASASASSEGFDTATCKDFHPLVDGSTAQATSPSVDTEDFVPYRTKGREHEPHILRVPARRVSALSQAALPRGGRAGRLLHPPH
ncbi:hypothetical protein MTO96_042146, partial [Rhipicephalus appendiculatus]